MKYFIIVGIIILMLASCAHRRSYNTTPHRSSPASNPQYGYGGLIGGARDSARKFHRGRGQVSSGSTTNPLSGAVALESDIPNDRDLGEGADKEPFGCIIMPRPDKTHNESYEGLRDNPYKLVNFGHDSSTFSTDVDTASYSNIRRFLQQQQQRPPKDAVRIEEMMNYFSYNYPQTKSDHPFAMHPQLTNCPWNKAHQILRIGIQGETVKDRPTTTLVFLIDISGSMNRDNKLGLVKKSFSLLLDQLNENDTVAIVTYAGNAGVALAATPGNEKKKILGALNNLHAGGSTAGAAGIQEAYRIARQHLAENGQTRVILATDGDFNVGVSNQDELVTLIRKEAKGGIFLNVLGFGNGNYQDARMEKISNDGNGTYAYMDSIREARKYFGEDLLGNLVTIAKDVKIQLFFNPEHVQAWRLIGYANRILKKEDFNNDTIDAGEIGAGLQVTALYEIIPTGTALPGTVPDNNPFISATDKKTSFVSELSDELKDKICRLRLRYKPLNSDSSILIEKDIANAVHPADSDSQWAMSTAAFGMLLRESVYTGDLNWSALIKMAKKSKGTDNEGHRAEAIRLMELARDM